MCVSAPQTSPPFARSPADAPALASLCRAVRANYLDVTNAHVGLVSAVGNCLSSLAAMLAPLLVSALLERYNSWAPVWWTLAAASLMAAAAFIRLATATPVEDTLAPKKHE